MRIAIKFAYDGSKFYGSQRQADVKTVEGEIIEVLTKHNVIDDPNTSKFQIASRTDAGVSAIGNVFACNSDFKHKDILNILNSKLKACYFYGLTPVDDEFNPRKAKQRWYRYHLFIGTDNLPNLMISNFEQDSFKKALSLFEGKHDFKNFVNPHVEDTERTIDSVTMVDNGAWKLVDIKARSFLWHQIRRIINACVRCGNGEIEHSKLNSVLDDPGIAFDSGLAPPEPLFLMDVDYDLDFRINDQVLAKTRRRLTNQWHGIKIQENIFDYLFKKF